MCIRIIFSMIWNLLRLTPLSTCALHESVFPPPDCLISENKLSSGSWENRLGTHLRLVLPLTYVCMIWYIDWQVRCRSPWSWWVINILDFCAFVRLGKQGGYPILPIGKPFGYTNPSIWSVESDYPTLWYHHIPTHTSDMF